MHNTQMLVTANTHQLFHALLRLAGRQLDSQGAHDGVADRDRGAVSLEQVLWFVAAGVSVAVIAGILWNKLRDTARDDTIIDSPSAPTP